MANIILKNPGSGESVRITDVDLSKTSARELVHAAIRNGFLEPYDDEEDSDCYYFILDKQKIPIVEERNNTLSSFGFMDGDELVCVARPHGDPNYASMIIASFRKFREYELLRKIQSHPNLNNEVINITIQYKDDTTNTWESILSGSTNRYVKMPKRVFSAWNEGNFYVPKFSGTFRITYKMPVYVAPDKLVTDWESTFILDTQGLSIRPQSNAKLLIENGEFPRGLTPFNPHIHKDWIDMGCLLRAANEGCGIWFYVIGIGALLNMDTFAMDLHPVNPSEAYLWWVNERKMQPTSKIDWPFNLSDNFVIDKLPYEYDDEKQSFWFGEPYIEKKQRAFTFGR